MKTVEYDPRDRHGYVKCYRCGIDCGMDFSLPDEVWRRISPTGGHAGMLCLWCADELCVEHGIRFNGVRVYFPGKALCTDLYGADYTSGPLWERLFHAARTVWAILSGDYWQGTPHALGWGESVRRTKECERWCREAA